MIHLVIEKLYNSRRKNEYRVQRLSALAAMKNDDEVVSLNNPDGVDRPKTASILEK